MAPTTRSQANPPHFDTLKSMPFKRNDDELAITVAGRPQSIKRTDSRGGKTYRFNTQKKLQKEFVAAISKAQTLNGFSPKSFGRSNIKVRAEFVFPLKNGNIQNDVDNLAKFLLDSFQLKDKNGVSLCNNDRQVVRLTVSKMYGIACGEGLTMFRIKKTTEEAPKNYRPFWVNDDDDNNDDDDRSVDIQEVIDLTLDHSSSL